MPNSTVEPEPTSATTLAKARTDFTNWFKKDLEKLISKVIRFLPNEEDEDIEEEKGRPKDEEGTIEDDVTRRRNERKRFLKIIQEFEEFQLPKDYMSTGIPMGSTTKITLNNKGKMELGVKEDGGINGKDKENDGSDIDPLVGHICKVVAVIP